MDITYGEVADVAPEGFLPRRVHFTTMTRLNEGTKEGMLTRILSGAGWTTRELPQPLGFMPYTLHGDGPADVVGRVDAMKVSGNNVESWAWIMDDPTGERAYKMLALKAMRGTSVDMGDVKIDVAYDVSDEGDLSITANFVEAQFAGTTLCAQPAFATAMGELEASIAQFDLTASLAEPGDLDVSLPDLLMDPFSAKHLTAANTIYYPHDAFTMPEPDGYTPFQVSRDGSTVFGHLGSWEGCHTGFLDRCVQIPRSRTNYSKYCSSPQPTDKGRVWTGPLLFLNGHKATRAAINEALESMENVWANIVVVDGEFGPWACGVVLPDVTDEQLARARSGRVSGHWLDSELYAVVSVPVSGFEQTRQSEYSVEVNADGEVEYLAASFAVDCGCDEEPTVEDRLLAVERKLGIAPVIDPEEAAVNAANRLLALAVEAELATGDEDDA